MLTGLVAKDDGESAESDGDLVAATMTAGMWGGFGLGLLMTKGDTPDPRFSQASNTTVAPWMGRSGQLGVMAGGSF